MAEEIVPEEGSIEWTLAHLKSLRDTVENRLKIQFTFNKYDPEMDYLFKRTKEELKNVDAQIEAILIELEQKKNDSLHEWLNSPKQK